MKSHALAITIVVALCATLAMPRRTYAGDDEWATAGKILAGVVGLQVLQRGVRAGSHRDYKGRHHDHGHSRYHNYHGKRHRHRYRIIDRTRYRPRHDYSYRRDYLCDPIIIYESDCRRIYQPRIHGHTAYVQEWSPRCRKWVTIRTCDSVW